MELSKGKYKKKEVEEILSQIESEYDARIKNLKEQSEELASINKKITSELEYYKSQESLINSSIKSAEEKASELEESANKKYMLEMENLKTFCARFKGYFDYLIEKYPYYPAVVDSKKIFDNLSNSLFVNKNIKDVVEQTNSMINGNGDKPFNPQEKINEYIAATSDSGFNLDEVLNPGELHLEDLCKELGLIEEE